MWTLVAILVLAQNGEPTDVEVTRNLPSREACGDAMAARKEKGASEGKEMYLVCIPKPATKDTQTRSIKL